MALSRLLRHGDDGLASLLQQRDGRTHRIHQIGDDGSNHISTVGMMTAVPRSNLPSPAASRG